MKKILIVSILIAIVLTVSITTVSAQSKYNIPSWVKGVAGYWSEGKITDDDFGEGLAFLIDNEIIKVPKIKELQDKVIQLQSENAQLRSKLNLPKSNNDSMDANPVNAFISVKTDNSSYNEGDVIIVSGKVATAIAGTPVTMQLFNQGNLIDISGIAVAGDGSYSTTINAEGPLWTNSGEYTIRILFGEGNIAETTFSFLKKIGESHKTKIFEVNAASYGTFDVEYSITGGMVKDIKINPDNFALIVTIESTQKGSLLLEIPREALDAKGQDKSDKKFLVLIDEIQVLYKEDITNSNSRKITINFEKGDSDIKIIGTIMPKIQKQIDDINKINLENNYSPKERDWQTSGPFQIDRSKYAIGEKIFLVIGGLNANEKGEVAFMRPLDDTHYSEYQTVSFEGTAKPAFNYYIDPQISKVREICSVNDIVGKWTVVFRGTDYPNLYFEIIKDIVPGTNVKPVC